MWSRRIIQPSFVRVNIGVRMRLMHHSYILQQALAGRSGAGGVLQHGGEKSSEGRSGGGRVCYVVFSQPEEVELALRLCSGGEVPCEVGRSGLGLEKWCRQYAASRPKIHNLKNSADKFVGGDIDKVCCASTQSLVCIMA